jgi:hypothetical protein
MPGKKFAPAGAMDDCQTGRRPNQIHRAFQPGPGGGLTCVQAGVIMSIYFITFEHMAFV